jgi:hypothetical protein
MMLRGRLVVHGADLEKLARAAIRDSGLRLPWHREEDLLAELVAVAWELSEKHDERRHPNGFAKGCYRVLRLRVVDHIRKTQGRTKWQFSPEVAQRSGGRRVVEDDGIALVERSRPSVLSLDAPVGSDIDSELGEAVAALFVDASTDRDSTLGRALRSRDSEAGRPSDEERRRTPGRARDRASRGL